VKLDADILDALAAATTAGNELYLPARLAPELYQRVDAALQSAGGNWSKARKAHVFPFLASAGLAALRAEREVTTAEERKQRTQFFATPPDVADQLIGLAGLGPGHVVLEPSAGDGAIVRRLPAVAAVDCVEADPERARILQTGLPRQPRSVTEADFLTLPPRPVYDRVIMNPPFARGADVRHVLHALRFVKPGGRLVAVMLPASASRGNAEARQLSALMKDYEGWFEAVEDGAFARAGTHVAVAVAVIQPPSPSSQRPGEPIRVTTDSTNWRERLFNPVAFRPGAYERWDPWQQRDVVFRFAGNCIGCGANTWAHDDGCDDVRGPFGASTCVPLIAEDFPGVQVPWDASFPRCADCWDDQQRSERARQAALATLVPGAAGRVPGVRSEATEVPLLPPGPGHVPRRTGLPPRAPTRPATLQRAGEPDGLAGETAAEPAGVLMIGDLDPAGLEL
jgi:predicted RNA methylase